MPESCAAIIDRLIEERHHQGLSQKELAACLYVSDKAVSKWERGLSVPEI